MGIDALDVPFRLEKQFGLRRVMREWSREWPPLGRLYDGEPDVTAGELAVLVRRMPGRRPAPPVGSPSLESPPVPPVNGPAPLPYESHVGGPWPPPPGFDLGVCRVPADALGVPESDIVPRSRLIRDRGMS